MTHGALWIDALRPHNGYIDPVRASRRRGRVTLARSLLALATVPMLMGSVISQAVPPRPAAAHRVPRIVSINPCIDAVLMQVADPAQIAGISHYSQDPQATSISLATARRFRATSGTAEEVVALAPDLVLAGQHVAPSTVAMLQRMHIRFVQFPVPTTLAETEDQVRAIGSAIGQPQRGAMLARRIANAAIAARPSDTQRIPALIWQGGGLVPGKGTLSDALLQTAGFENMSASYGLTQWDILPLEYLVARPPRVLLSVGQGAGSGDRMLSHPVVTKLGKRIAIRPFAPRLMNCAGPNVIDALERLKTIRKELISR